MKDTIRGKVIEVVDGDTFNIRVTGTGRSNQYPYNGNERIRIADIDAPELNTRSGRRSKTMLERKLKGKVVRCRVDTRDKYGRIIAKVSR